MNRKHLFRAAFFAGRKSVGCGFSSATPAGLAPMQGGRLFQTRYRPDWKQGHFVGGYNASA